MITKKWQPYPTYKDSGVEWLGAIPEHWEMVKFSHFIDFQEGPGIMADDFKDEGVPLLRITNLKPGYVDIEGCNYLAIDKVEQKWKHFRLLANDLLISCSASTGLVSIVDQKSANSIAYTGIIRLRPARNNIARDFIRVLVGSDFYFTQINQLKTGTTIQHYGPVHLKQIKIPIPPLPEQQKIAEFLDEETSKIDKLITKKERLIELLKEKRTALISHAVTKGLNPDVPMKDSGVEWLGEIPEHWEVMPIKFALDIPITDGPHETPELYDEGIPFISAESIKNDRIDFDKKRGFISLEEHKRFSRKYKPQYGDVYMVKSGATTGNVARVETEEEFNIWSPLAVLRPNKDVTTTNFLFYAMKSKPFFYSVELSWSFGTQQNIGMGVISNIRIVLPPLPEQQKIAEFLDRETSKIDNLITKTRTSIDHLKEYRTALISAAVTGKIDVREH
jgi:type I restriction enzyme S subunit